MDARNDSGLSALHLAARAGETDIARLLIIKGADINDGRNDFGVTPLHLASGENQVETVRMLLEFGADTTLPDVNGDSALSRAERHEHWEVVTTLLAGGSSCQSRAKVGQRLYRECASRARDN